MIISTVPRSDAPYQGFQLGSMWYISLDYIGHQTSLNTAQAQTDPDGMIRMGGAPAAIPVSPTAVRTPRLAGILPIRWQRTSAPIPCRRDTAQVIAFDDVRNTSVPLPQRDRRRRFGGADRRPTARHREQDVGVRARPTGLLDGKVVVVGGVGPGLGRSICLQSAAARGMDRARGTDPERLRAVADEITTAGGVAHAVPTDITSTRRSTPSSRRRWSSSAASTRSSTTPSPCPR